MPSWKKEVRRRFREACYERDGHKCRVCGAEGVKLDAHHVTDRTLLEFGGYVSENGISLCEPCHEKAEVWHSSGHKDWKVGYHPDELYKLIGSNYDKAVHASERLSR